MSRSGTEIKTTLDAEERREWQRRKREQLLSLPYVTEADLRGLDRKAIEWLRETIWRRHVNVKRQCRVADGRGSKLLYSIFPEERERDAERNAKTFEAMLRLPAMARERIEQARRAALLRSLERAARKLSTDALTDLVRGVQRQARESSVVEGEVVESIAPGERRAIVSGGATARAG